MTKPDTIQLYEVNEYEDTAFPYAIYRTTEQGSIPATGRGFRDPHWHEDLQITVAVRGSLVMQVNGREYVLQQGEGLFIPRNLLHTCTVLSPDGCFYGYNFSDKLLRFFPGSRMEQDHVIPYLRHGALPVTLLSPSVPWQAEILSLLVRSNELLNSHPAFWEYQLSVYTVQIWLLLVRNLHSLPQTFLPGDLIRQQRTQAMLHHIHTHYATPLTVHDIAAAANISPSECSRCFHALLHTSAYQYLNNYRIEQSLPLLAKTILPLQQVAEQVGFGTASNYIHQFRRRMQITPQQYRKQAAK